MVGRGPGFPLLLVLLSAALPRSFFLQSLVLHEASSLFYSAVYSCGPSEKRLAEFPECLCLPEYGVYIDGRSQLYEHLVNSEAEENLFYSLQMAFVSYMLP